MEEAAAQCGIPIEEVYQHVTQRAEAVDTLNFQLRLIGQGAIRSALTKLTELAAGDQRASETKTVEVGADGPEITHEKLSPDDLEAAKALAKFGIDAIRLAKIGGAKSAGSEQQDLFDASDPWKLKKIE